jgi:hypothetical protein
VLPLLVMLYLAAMPSHLGADVDGLAYSQHRPMACSRQMGGQCYLAGVVLSCRSAVGGDPFWGC